MNLKRLFKKITPKKLLSFFYLILLGMVILALFIMVSFVNQQEEISLKHYQDISSSFARVAALEFNYEEDKLDSLESFSYEQLVNSDYNQDYEEILRPLMNKYDIVRVYVFRLLNEDELYINPLNPSSPPYDIKIKLEAVNDERIRHVRYETYEEVYRHDRSDEELRTNYLEQKDFARREIDSFGDFYTAYRPLYNENNEFIGYIGVETSLTSFVSNMNKLKSNVLGIAITLGCILIVILGIMIIIYRVDLSKRILEQSSFRDSTTGLYNRFIRRKLQKVLGKDTSVSYAFILIDIDEMEKINATYGRKNGDVLIKYVASVIKNQLRGSYDIPIYLGEDDFVIIIKDESVNNVTKIAKRIIDDMQQFKMFEAILSVGITLTNIDELTNNFNTAYARADAAIYEARNNKEDYQIAVRLKTEYTGEDVLL